MPDIFLFIPDNSLYEAVIEQVAAAGFGNVRRLATPQEEVRPESAENPALVVAESPEGNEEAAVLVRELNQNLGMPTIFMLGGRGDVEGAAETFLKPLRLGHLIARMKHYLETEPILRQRAVVFGPYRLDPKTRQAARAGSGEAVRLTEKETALLVYLAQKKEAASRKDILAGVWGYDEQIDTHTLETHIYQLRRKLDREGEVWIVNEAGAYRLAGLKE